MLENTVPTLPSNWYFDPEHYQRELTEVWSRAWLCVGRVSDWAEPGDWRRITLADQQIMVVHGVDGDLRAFHNTCRHRGSVLCTGEQGRFRNGRIVCPYHAWVYSLDGRLQATPRRTPTANFDPDDFPLYPVALDTWGGFAFINLSDAPPALSDTLGGEAARLAKWPLAQLALAHREQHEVGCNWKVFWENFLECYHCPGVHPDLCRLVPMYGEARNDPNDLPEGHPLRHSGNPLREGAETWSIDGQTPLPFFESLGPEEREAGMTFSTLVPTMFVVGHVDYVRSVRVWPLGPERTRLTVDWMLLPEVLGAGVDIERLTAFARQVVTEDAGVCELNQQGLHSRRHEHGVLLPLEYDVLDFQNWVRKRLGVQSVSG